MAHPDSYTTYTSLPEISFAHVPSTAPTATPVIILKLDRPASKNAFTRTMSSSLVSAFNLLSTDPRVKAIVFTGSDPTNRIFCPGMDLDMAMPGSIPASELPAARAAYRDTAGEVTMAVYRCAKPVVVAINGHAVGVGITMTLAANLRVVSEKAKVGFVFGRRAFSLEGCSSYFLPRILGAGRALTVATTGSAYMASDPAVRDLFAEIVPPERVISRAVELAEEIASKTSAVAVRTMKEMLYRGAPKTPEEAFQMESPIFFDLFHSRDGVEGVKSFMEKRDPKFEGVWEKDRPSTWPWWEESEKDRGACKSKL